MDDATVRPAGAGEATTVLAILDEAAAWLGERCIAQWPPAFPREWVEARVGDGRMWLAECDGEPLGTMLLTWSDPLWPDDGAAGYVHRIAIRRRARGLGAWMLDEAGAVVAGRGRTQLRLECVAGNARLRGYYEGLGFVHRGDVEYPAKELLWSRPPLWVSRYERPVGR